MKSKENLYARMLTGDLSSSEIEALKSTGEWEELEKIIKASGNLQLPAYDTEVGYEQLKASLKKPKSKVLKIRRIWTAGIAASFLVVLCTILFIKNQQTTIASNSDTPRTHNFKDNSTVTLNDGSTISYDNRNWSTNRNVLLTGEALFQVKKGSPFIIETENGKVEVLGTSFNIRSWGDILYVECYSGRVRVTNQDLAVILEGLQMVRFVEGEEPLIQPIDHNRPFWTNNLSKFNQENLTEVFKELERQYQIEVISRIKGEKSFTGSFTHLSLEDALKQICLPMGLSTKIDRDEMTVTITE